LTIKQLARKSRISKETEEEILDAQKYDGMAIFETERTKKVYYQVNGDDDDDDDDIFVATFP
jgi:hypothetical protein